jgi:hypothetical protein
MVVILWRRLCRNGKYFVHFLQLPQRSSTPSCSYAAFQSSCSLIKQTETLSVPGCLPSEILQNCFHFPRGCDKIWFCFNCSISHWDVDSERLVFLTEHTCKTPNIRGSHQIFEDLKWQNPIRLFSVVIAKYDLIQMVLLEYRRIPLRVSKTDV